MKEMIKYYYLSSNNPYINIVKLPCNNERNVYLIANSITLIGENKSNLVKK